MNLIGIASAAVGEMQNKRLQALYQKDFAAWQSDILGLRTYEKMQSIVDEALFGEKNRTAIKSSNGVSKDLALDTPILTTEGWKTMGSVRVGDFVYSEGGTPIPVVGKSEVFNKPSFRVVFDDGSYLVTSDTHEWNTLTLSERKSSKARDWRDHWDCSSIRTTGEIASTLLGNRGRSKNHLIPLTRPVEFPERNVIIPPYILGAWLGDGTAVRAEITCDYETDGYIVDRFAELGYPLRKRENTPYSFVAICDAPGLIKGSTSRLKLALDALGVVGNKHIPEEYVFSSVDQRIELIRGLMDTDGSVHGARACWGQSNARLVGQFCDILTSLGVKFTLHSYTPPVGKETWAVVFRPWFDPFTPGERKSKALGTRSRKQESRLTGRTIVSVDPIPSVPTQCIQVDSERHLYLAGSGLIPTHNSFTMSSVITWAGSAFDVGETLSIVTAPSRDQVERVVWNYLKEFRTRAAKRGHELPGFLNEQIEWKIKIDGVNRDIAYGKVPSRGDEVSVFQGTRSAFGKTFVFVEEAGGISENLFVAAEAVLTGEEARGFFIGNPDHVGGPWQRIFTDPKYAQDFNLFTVNAYDLPAFTGEVVYPEDPEMERIMLKNLTTREWVEQKRRMWGERSSFFMSKVLGEFPPDGGTGFFTPGDVATGRDTEIPEDAALPCVIGVDVARMGRDESVAYISQGGRVRLLDAWEKTDTYASSQRVYNLAKKFDPVEIRIDSTGVGAAVFDNLKGNPEFVGNWVVLGIDGSAASPDKSKYDNLRAYVYSSAKQQLADGLLDLDPDDKELLDELALIRYKFAAKGGILMEKKENMVNEIGGSPDRADAFVYTVADLSPWTGNPLNELTPGSVVVKDPGEVVYDRHWDAIEF